MDSLKSFIERRYDLGAIQDLRLLSENAGRHAYELRTPAGRFVIKISDEAETYKLRIHADALARLSGLGAAPELVPAKGGNRTVWYGRRLVCVNRWEEGYHPGFSLKTLGEVGELLGKIHDQPVADYRLRPLDFHELLGYWAQVYSRLPEDPEKARMEGVLKKRPNFSRLPVALTHGDVHPANMLRTGTGLKLIDFAQGGLAPRTFDVAYVLTSITAGYRLPFAKADGVRVFLKSYRRHCRLTRAEIRALPHMMDIHFLSFALGWEGDRLNGYNVRRYFRAKPELVPLFALSAERPDTRSNKKPGPKQIPVNRAATRSG